MKIQYLGHAGFAVETDAFVLVMDPWLSPTGAFDSAWFQFPCNHHLNEPTRALLSKPERPRFVYISHEHRDHLDEDFLRTLPANDITFIIPQLRRNALRALVEQLQPMRIIECPDGQRIPLHGGAFCELYVDDVEMDRDSAIVVSADGSTFVNLNDCKLNDRMRDIRGKHPRIDAFAAQFSGATWHPTCYDYPKERYEQIARTKIDGKFEAVARSIEILQPRVYIPSAGPACFLDPTLQHLNFEPVNIFPRAERVHEFLATRLQKERVDVPVMMPGDVLDVASGEIVVRVEERVDEAGFGKHIDEYARRTAPLFERLKGASSANPVSILERLRANLQKKLSAFTLPPVPVPLYFSLEEVPTPLRVDFVEKTVSVVNGMEHGPFYSIVAPAWQVERVLDRRLSWEEFSLTFRARIARDPDRYEPLVHALLILEPEDIDAWCRGAAARALVRDRIEVAAAGCRYAVDRFCPHQGSDLSNGWIEAERFLVCPRHQWHYDLLDGGRCAATEMSVHAELISDPD